MRTLELFAGIGGFAIAWQRLGFEHVQFVEFDPFCQAILSERFPGVPIHADVRSFDATSLRGRVDLVSGGPPCQPASLAGARKGNADARWLWPDFFRVVRECSPRWVVAENPLGIVTLEPHGLDWIIGELEAQGYEVLPIVVGADDVGAPHRRKRVFIVAHAKGRGRAPEGERRDESQLAGTGRVGAERGDGVADPNTSGRGASERNFHARESDAPWSNSRLADTNGDGVWHESGWIGGSSRPDSPVAGNAGQVAHSDRDGREQLRSGGLLDGERTSQRNDVDGCGARVGDTDSTRLTPGERSASGPVREDGRREKSNGRGLRWPARPGQPQHEWEPSRTVAGLGRGASGVSARLDSRLRRARLRALGNSIVPEVAYQIGRALVEASR